MTTYNALDTMQTIKFGIELEYTGLTRGAAAQAIQTVIGGTIQHVGMPSCYDPWKINGANGQTWTVTRDASVGNGGNHSVEVVSPPLMYTAMDTIQDIVRALREAGAKATSDCGMHIHLDGRRFSVAEVTRLAKLVYQQENLIQEALDQVKARLNNPQHCCRPAALESDLIQRIGNARTLPELQRGWYGTDHTNGRIMNHYDWSRYHGLNLHSLFYREAIHGCGTIEFRWFASTTHAGKVKSWIQFCLALGAKALNSRGVTARKRTFDTAHTKYAFRTFLIRLGLNGDEFKTLRHHTLGNLIGSSSWAHGTRQAQPAA